MEIIKFFIYLNLTLFFNVADAQQLYQMSDLLVLKNEGLYEEFFKHAFDIRPSERNEKWNKMLKEMGILSINQKILNQEFKENDFLEILNINNLKVLKNDQAFQIKKDLYSLKYLSKCFNDKLSPVENCQKNLQKFWESSLKNPDIALEMAKIIENHKLPIDTWDYYKTALNDSISSFYCQKKEVTNAIINRILNLSFRANFDGNYNNIIDQTVNKECFLKVKKPLIELLQMDSTPALKKELALNILEAKKILTPLESDLFSLLYLLDTPVVGDKMNSSWKKIEELSFKPQKREELISIIKNLKYLPDNIFKDPNLPRAKAIINLLAQKFPEFINYYGKTCLNLIQFKNQETGQLKGSFNCHQFFKVESNKKALKETLWASDILVEQYERK